MCRCMEQLQNNVLKLDEPAYHNFMFKNAERVFKLKPYSPPCPDQGTRRPLSSDFEDPAARASQEPEVPRLPGLLGRYDELSLVSKL